MGRRQSVASLPEASGSLIAQRYRVERVLGQGGMGTIYAAEDTISGRTVALKRLPRGASAKTMALFEREYRALASLRHSFIVEVYEYAADEQGPFYTMEIVEGADLSGQAPMPWRDVCNCLRDVASILGVLHARRLLHRDLSPRNLLRSTSGQLKLIDFGALAAFGPPTEVVGTPPLIAPEVLHGAPLDQRSDLFALGALGYWLLTGVHAFPARTIGELPRLWERELSPPSRLLARLGAPGIEPCPPALDAVLMALLSLDAAQRPDSTAELIDRLSAIAELAPEAHEYTARGYLDSKLFVGRARELSEARSALREAVSGTPRALVLEGEQGSGRTRLMQELVVIARLDGALVLTADASQGSRAYAAVLALALRLAALLPVEARAAAANHPALTRLSPELCAQLELPEPIRLVQDPRSERLALQRALVALFTEVSRTRCLALCIDDLHALDEESQAVLVALAHASEGAKLALLTTAVAVATTERSATFSAFRQTASRLVLAPLTGAETRELLGSVFGAAPYFERLAERLHRLSEGNPAHILALAEHLVRSGAARYEDGMWALPNELPEGLLPSTRTATRIAQLEHLSPAARALARRLSIPLQGAISLGECLTISALDSARTCALLGELCRAHVLRESADQFRFLHEEVQRTLHAELDPTTARDVHARLAAMLARSDAGDARLRVILHLFRAGDIAAARARMAALAEHYTEGDLGPLQKQVGLLEELYELLRARGEPRHARILPLSLLAISGYLVHRRYAARYGAPTLDAFEAIFHLRLARWLRRMIGRKLALIVTLLVCAIGLRRHRPLAPSLRGALRLLISASSALLATSVVTLDTKTARRCAALLAPFSGMGPDKAARVISDHLRALVTVLLDHPAEAAARLKANIARLESPRPIDGLPDSARATYLAGCYLSLSVTECWKDGDSPLQLADRMERFSPLHAMSADYVRVRYYAGQGELAHQAHFQKRMELHAVQLGSAWQIDTWAPLDAVKTALRTNDALMMKRAARELAQLVDEVPSLEAQARRVEGSYLMLRGKYAEALPLLVRHDEEPCSYIGWARSRGIIARCYNGLGEHDKARTVCLEALSHLHPDDLMYVDVNLNVQIELALAESGLGDVASAGARLDALLARHAPLRGPLTLGALHEARARVALRARDLVRAREHLQEMKHWFEPTQIPTLIELCNSLARQLASAEHQQTHPSHRSLDSDELERLQSVRLQRMLAQDESASRLERAARVLDVALTVAVADEGFVLLAESGTLPAAQQGGLAQDEIIAWARERMHASDDEANTMQSEEPAAMDDDTQRVLGRTHYYAVSLSSAHGLAVLVLGSHDRPAQTLAPEIVRMLSAHLARRTIPAQG